MPKSKLGDAMGLVFDAFKIDKPAEPPPEVPIDVLREALRVEQQFGRAVARERDDLRAKLAEAEQTIAGLDIEIVGAMNDYALGKKRAEAAEARLATAEAVLVSVRLERDNLEADVARLTESLGAARRGREAAGTRVRERLKGNS
jgi:chromosome segregation ATPase